MKPPLQKYVFIKFKCVRAHSATSRNELDSSDTSASEEFFAPAHLAVEKMIRYVQSSQMSALSPPNGSNIVGVP